MLILMLALTTPFAGQAVSVAQQAPAAIPAPPAAVAEKPVCRRIVRTGSNFPTRICHTKEQWRAIDDANQAGVERASRNRPGN